MVPAHRASVWHVVPVGFFVFMPSMGVALLRRRSRVKGVLRYRRKGRDVFGSAASTRLSGSCPLVIVEREQSHALSARRSRLAVMAAWRMVPPDVHRQPCSTGRIWTRARGDRFRIRRVYRPVDVGGRVAGYVRVVFEVEHAAG
jgi:hypothetical protein